MVGAAVGDFVGAGVVAVSVVKVTVKELDAVAALLMVTLEESTATTIVSSSMPETEVTEAPTVIEEETEGDKSVKTFKPVVAETETDVTIV